MSDTKDVQEILGDDAYVIGRNPTSNVLGPLEFFDDMTDVTSYLDSYSAASEGQLKLLNGIVANVLSIPKTIPKALEIMLLIPHAYGTDRGIIIEITDLDNLEETIMTIMQEVIEIKESSEVNKVLEDINTQRIEDLYVLYGYEMELFYHFEPDDTDEEMVDSALKVYNRIKEMQ